MNAAQALAAEFTRQPSVRAFRQAHEPAVLAWKWSMGRQFVTDVPPFTWELIGEAPPPLLDEPPSEGGMCCQYGFDGSGRCLIARLRDIEGGYQGTLAEQFYFYESEGFRSYRFNCVGANSSLFMVSVQRWDGPRLVNLENWTQNSGYFAMEYRYENGMVVETIESRGDPPQLHRVERMRRDATGGVTSITTGDETMWSRDPASPSVNEAQLVSMMSADIAASLSPFDDRPVWWLVWLRYSNDGELWSDAGWPVVSVATLEDRRTLASAASSEWRLGWDWLDWTHDEIEVQLRLETRVELDALGRESNAEDLPRFLGRVADVVADLLRTDATIIAADADLQLLDIALEALSPLRRNDLEEVGFTPWCA